MFAPERPVTAPIRHEHQPRARPYVVGYSGYIPGLMFNYGQPFAKAAEDCVVTFLKHQEEKTLTRTVETERRCKSLPRMRSVRATDTGRGGHFMYAIDESYPPLPGYTGHIPHVTRNTIIGRSVASATRERRVSRQRSQEVSLERYLEPTIASRAKQVKIIHEDEVIVHETETRVEDVQETSYSERESNSLAGVIKCNACTDETDSSSRDVNTTEVIRSDAASNLHEDLPKNRRLSPKFSNMNREMLGHDRFKSSTQKDKTVTPKISKSSSYSHSPNLRVKSSIQNSQSKTSSKTTRHTARPKSAIVLDRSSGSKVSESSSIGTKATRKPSQETSKVSTSPSKGTKGPKKSSYEPSKESQSPSKVAKDTTKSPKIPSKTGTSPSKVVKDTPKSSVRSPKPVKSSTKQMKDNSKDIKNSSKTNQNISKRFTEEIKTKEVVNANNKVSVKTEDVIRSSDTKEKNEPVKENVTNTTKDNNDKTTEKKAPIDADKRNETTEISTSVSPESSSETSIKSSKGGNVFSKIMDSIKGPSKGSSDDSGKQTSKVLNSPPESVKESRTESSKGNLSKEVNKDDAVKKQPEKVSQYRESLLDKTKSAKTSDEVPKSTQQPEIIDKGSKNSDTLTTKNEPSQKGLSSAVCKDESMNSSKLLITSEEGDLTKSIHEGFEKVPLKESKEDSGKGKFKISNIFSSLKGDSKDKSKNKNNSSDQTTLNKDTVSETASISSSASIDTNKELDSSASIKEKESKLSEKV